MSQCYIRRRKNKPYPYTIVDFIKFDGTINSVYDTGITSGNKRVSITFDLGGSSSSNGGIFGMNGSYPKSYAMLKYNGSGQFSTSTGSSRTTFTVQDSDTGKHTFINNINGKNLFDGTEVTAYSTYTSSYTYRFGMSVISSTYYYSGKIYEIKITDNADDSVLLWLIPVSYDDNGTTKYGFYDNVSKTLVTKTGWTGGYDPPVEIVSWATGTPEKIAAMLQAHDDGIINIYDYWNIGDERTVSLGAISAGTVLPAMAAQTVTMVLMNEGYNGQSGIHYVVGQKDCLSNDSDMNTSSTNAGSWGSTGVRSDLNSGYYNAFPVDEKALFKPFNTVTISEYDSTTLQTVQDYFALPAEKEVQGVATYSVAEEAAALSQFEYYETAANRIKKKGSSARRWYYRSPRAGYYNQFCQGYTDGAAWYASANAGWGIAPFGCI